MQTHHTPTYATIGAAGAWDFFIKVLEHGPSWESLPSLMLAFVALISAVNTFRNDAVKRAKALGTIAPSTPDNAQGHPVPPPGLGPK